MSIKKKINIFIQKKIKSKKIKVSISNSTDLFINQVFDSLDYADLTSALDALGYELDIQKNDYKIPRNKNEIFKIVKSKSKIKIREKIQLTKNNITEEFVNNIKTSFNIKKNQNVIIHSNFSNLNKIGVTPAKFIEEMLKKNPGLKIFVPAGFFRIKKKKYDFKDGNSPTNEFGLLTNTILNEYKSKIIRNKNPFDNLICLSKIKNFKSFNNSLAYGPESPYRNLLNKNTYIILIDVTFFYLSMLHMTELDAKVPYRTLIDFKFKNKIFKLYARKDKKKYLDYNKFFRENNVKKLCKILNFNKSKIIYANYTQVYNECLKILKKNPHFLCKK